MSRSVGIVPVSGVVRLVIVASGAAGTAVVCGATDLVAVCARVSVGSSTSILWFSILPSSRVVEAFGF